MLHQENIILYPAPETIFADPTLALYFKPLLSALIQVAKKPCMIHLLSRDGLICKEEPAFRYAEHYCFGFRFLQGRYDYLGDLHVFENADQVPVLYRFLQEDFEQNKDQYLKNKTTLKEYQESLHSSLQAVSGLSNFENARQYAGSFYSYEFTKYYYQKYGAHRHISVVTQQYAKNTDPFLLDEEDAQDILEEWLDGFEEDAAYEYGLATTMFAAGTESRRFVSLSGSGFVMALLDAEKETVYLVECSS